MIRELMPWVRQRYNVIADPESVVIGGSSLGGLTAAYLGLHHPDVFGNVLSQSGAFWWAEGMTASDAPDATKELNGIARLAINQPKGSLRFYLEAGTFEAPKGPDLVRILVTTRHLRDVLVARGYDVQYHQFAGGHEAINWRGSVADGLVALLRR